MTDQQTTVDQGTATEAVLAAQMAIIDAAVRASRNNGWCGEFEQVMGLIFPDGPPDGSREFVDSDGFSCRGMDRDGYRNGFDRNGFDRDGYNANGYNAEGYDRDGYNRQDRDRDGWDRGGYDVNGFNRDGVHRDGYTRDSDEYRTRFRFDARGYDREGFNAHGLDPYGMTREQRADASRYVYEADANGNGYLWDANGIGPDGYDREGRLRDRARRGY